MHANAGGRRLASGPTWTSGGVRGAARLGRARGVHRRSDRKGNVRDGRPFADNSGSLSLLEGVSVDEAKRIIADDPFVENGVFVLDDVREWNVFVDELSARV